MRREEAAASKAERELVRRLRRGDERAAEQLLEDYGDRLFRFALPRLGHDLELTREVLQQTLCKVISLGWSFRGEAGLFTWLCTCCKNMIYDHRQRHQREAAGRSLDQMLDGAEVAAVEMADSHPGPEALLGKRELAEEVHEALDHLPVHYAKVLEWKYLENTAVREIATRLELSEKAAESLLTRARSAFRRAFRRESPRPVVVQRGLGTSV